MSPLSKHMKPQMKIFLPVCLDQRRPGRLRRRLRLPGRRSARCQGDRRRRDRAHHQDSGKLAVRPPAARRRTRRQVPRPLSRHARRQPHGFPAKRSRRVRALPPDARRSHPQARATPVSRTSFSSATSSGSTNASPSSPTCWRTKNSISPPTRPFPTTARTRPARPISTAAQSPLAAATALRIPPGKTRREKGGGHRQNPQPPPRPDRGDDAQTRRQGACSKSI